MAASKTKTDMTQLISMALEGLNSLANVYVSVSVARLKADVYAAAYAAHISQGKLPEEAMSLALRAAEAMHSTVSGN